MLGLHGVSGQCSHCCVCVYVYGFLISIPNILCLVISCHLLTYYIGSCVISLVMSAAAQCKCVCVCAYTVIRMCCTHLHWVITVCSIRIYSVCCPIVLVCTYICLLCILDCCHLLLMLTDPNTYGWLCVTVCILCVYIYMQCLWTLSFLGELPVGGGQQRWQEGVAGSCRPLLGGCSRVGWGCEIPYWTGCCVNSVSLQDGQWKFFD